MLDKIAVGFVLATLFLIYAVAKPTDAAEVIIGVLAGACLMYLAITFCQWSSRQQKG